MFAVIWVVTLLFTPTLTVWLFALRCSGGYYWLDPVVTFLPLPRSGLPRITRFTPLHPCGSTHIYDHTRSVPRYHSHATYPFPTQLVIWIPLATLSPVTYTVGFSPRVACHYRDSVAFPVLRSPAVYLTVTLHICLHSLRTRLRCLHTICSTLVDLFTRRYTPHTYHAIHTFACCTPTHTTQVGCAWFTIGWLHTRCTGYLVGSPYRYLTASSHTHHT